MPITITQPVPGMPAEAYDEVIGNIGDALRAAPGFISHAAVVDAGGATVTEVWETRDQWASWFQSSVQPHLPPGVPEATVTELHNGFGR